MVNSDIMRKLPLGKLSLGKVYIWEIATWEVAFGKVPNTVTVTPPPPSTHKGIFTTNPNYHGIFAI